VTVVVTGGKIHFAIHFGWILTQHLFDRTHPLDELNPIHCPQKAKAAYAVAYRDLVSSLFLVFGKRRRRADEPDDEALAGLAATGYAYVPTPRLASASAAAPVVNAAAAAAVSAVQAASDLAPAPERDAHLPRWRRPSLIEARKADPLRGEVAESARLTFDGRAGEAVSGLERRRIRYRMVSLLNLPDEIRGVEIGSLDEGDEVVLMEKHGTYWRVLCPDGREGWLHKMTLGDVVIDTSDAADSWTAADEAPSRGGFEDVLRAYAESRRQFGEI